MVEKLNAVLKEYGLTIGLSNDKRAAGTWEWFDKDAEKYGNGFLTAAECYTAAAAYIAVQYGYDLPALDEDGGFTVPAEKVSANRKPSGMSCG